MATFKVLVLPTQKKEDGTYNVKIRMTHKRTTRYISTPFFISQDQLTARSYKIKNQLILDSAEAEVRKMRERLLQIGFAADSLTADELLRLLRQPQADEVSFTEYMQSKIDEMQKNNTRGKTPQSYQVTLNTLLAYNDNKPLYFYQMTKGYMISFYQYLLSNQKVVTANNRISILKSFYNKAIQELNDEEAGIIIVKYRCFDALKLEKPEEIRPRSFERVGEMQAVIDTEYGKQWIYEFSKDLFIFSFCCLGINPADIIRLKKSDYKDGILTYRRKKIERTVGLKSEIQIRVPEPARIIIDKYNGDEEYLIDFRGHTRRIEVCRYIHYTFQKAGIEKDNKGEVNGVHKSNYVFYSARHTMATFARNICGIDKYTVHEMLNHTGSREFATTDVYLRRDFTHLWEANDKLMALFDWSFYLKQKKDPE